MKTGLHPDYKEVVFFDTSCDFKFLTRSTMETKGKETIKWTDGNEYPLVKIEVSSESHPFYTGKHKIVDTAGRVEKFRQRYARKSAMDTPAPENLAAADTHAAKKPAGNETIAAKKLATTETPTAKPPAASDKAAAKKPAATDTHAAKKPLAK